MEKDEFGYGIYRCNGGRVYLKMNGVGRIDGGDVELVGKEVGGLVKKILVKGDEKGNARTCHVLVSPPEGEGFYISAYVINWKVRISLPSPKIKLKKNGEFFRGSSKKTSNSDEILDFNPLL